MARAVKRDDGLYQCNDCEYGHDVGKSRQAVYKHWKKVHGQEAEDETMIHIEETREPTDDLEDVDEWGSIGWLSPDEEADVVPDTIPSPMRRLAQAQGDAALTAAQRVMEKSLVRYSFMGLDRLLTWYGRSLMTDQEWELRRSQNDYDVLQDTTMAMMDAYGIRVPASPWMIWGTVVGSAYVPPVIHIQRNADPSKRRRFRFLGFLGRIRNPFKRRKKARRDPDDDLES